jgi:hypothetical protein
MAPQREFTVDWEIKQLSAGYTPYNNSTSRIVANRWTHLLLLSYSLITRQQIPKIKYHTWEIYVCISLLNDSWKVAYLCCRLTTWRRGGVLSVEKKKNYRYSTGIQRDPVAGGQYVKIVNGSMRRVTGKGKECEMESLMS